jgi:hypothetical protein
MAAFPIGCLTKHQANQKFLISSIYLKDKEINKT